MLTHKLLMTWLLQLNKVLFVLINRLSVQMLLQIIALVAIELLVQASTMSNLKQILHLLKLVIIRRVRSEKSVCLHLR
jgi:hypothetical protein